MAARCRSCGEPIRWVKMESGKAMPVNPKPVTMIALDEERCGGALFRTTGRAVQVYESHFATCPDAGEHRKAS